MRVGFLLDLNECRLNVAGVGQTRNAGLLQGPSQKESKSEL
jgi:hypothetical protein